MTYANIENGDTGSVARGKINGIGNALDSLLSVSGSNANWGGDTIGEKKVIGSNDDYDIGFETNGTERITILKTGEVGVGTTTPSNKFSVHSNSDEDVNYISIGGADDKTRGFEIGSKGEYKWSNYIYDGEDGDVQYFASGNSGRDILVMQSGGRVGLNMPTLLDDIDILRIVQSGTNIYATITCEIPHKLANNTLITIEGATTAKFNGNFIISNVTTMTFRITGLEVGAISEEPTDAKVMIETTIPAAFAIFPQYFDDIYTFDKALDTGPGTGYNNITANMRTSFGVADIILPLEVGSYLYIGKKYPWRATNFNIETSSAGSTSITVQYSTVDNWTTLTTSTTSGNGLVDGTSRLTKDGNITWNLNTFKNLWKTQSIQVNPTPKYTPELYWIRISLNAITTSPTAKAIGNHGIDRMAIYSQSGDITPTFSVDSLGRVGFLPAELETKYTLGTLSGLQSSKFEVVAEDGTRSDFIYYVANDASDQHPAIIFARSSGTVATKTPVINGMDIGGVYGDGYDGATFRELGKILIESAKLATSGDASGRISFWTRNATTADAERMRITETGLVGIGTLVPAKQLDINSVTGECLQLTYNDNNGSAANKVTMDVSSSGSLVIKPSGNIVNISGDLTVSGSIISTGYINGEKSGVFAYLTTSASTACLVGDTYYPISGSFANNPIYNFTLVATPAIKYVNSQTQYFKIAYFADFFVTANSRTVSVGIKVNGNLVDTSICNTFAKTAGEHFPISGLTVVELKPNDEVQLVVACNATETITFHHFSTAIDRFFT